MPDNSRNSKSPKKVLAHMKGKIAKNEYSYEHPVLQTHNIYLLEHKYKGYK